MSTWTTIPDSSLEPGKPARSIDALALRDNPIAIAIGASGAPKIEAAALNTDSDMRDWVLARTAAASVGAVGTYAFLIGDAGNDFTAGSTYAGSVLQYGGVYSDSFPVGNTIRNGSSATAPSGTWRAMGTAVGSDSAHACLTLFLRIS